MRSTITLLFTLFCLTMPVTLLAQMSFDAASVGKFITTLASMKDISDKYGQPEQLQEMGSISDTMARAQAPFSSSIKDMENYQGYDEMRSVIKANGFGDVAQWAQFGDRLMRAYGAVKMAAELPEADQQMAQALKQLESSGLSDAQKKMMLEMMKSATQVVDNFKDVPESDKAAVRPHIASLDNMK